MFTKKDTILVFEPFNLFIHASKSLFYDNTDCYTAVIRFS